MKKSLIALAVAGTFAAPAFAATSNVDISGKFAMDVGTVSGTGNNNATTHMNDNNSSITIKGSEDLGGGMKALFSSTWGLNANTKTSALGGQAQYLGLSGGFGTVTLGTQDNIVKGVGRATDLFKDQSAGDARTLTNVGNIDNRLPNVVAYTSPSFSGFTVALAHAMDETKAANGGTANMVTANYANGPLSVGVGYYRVDNAAAVAGNDESGYRLGAGYKFGDAKVVGMYQSIKNASGTDVNDIKNWLVGGSYAMGPVTLKAQYQDLNDKTANKDANMWSVGADYSLSKRTTVQASYSRVKNDSGVGYGASNVGGNDAIAVVNGKDPSRVAVGLVHTF